jgi:tetratricopeptide (TPR) repeat protein
LGRAKRRPRRAVVFQVGAERGPSSPEPERPLPGAEGALWLQPTSGFAASWNGVLRLIDGVCELTGADRVRRVLLKHKAAASLLFPGLLERLDAEERRQRERMSAHWDCHLTHNHAIQSPLFQAWGRLLNELLEEGPEALVLPAAHLLDAESLIALRAMVRARREDGPDVLLCYEPTAIPERDSRGLIWRETPRAIEHYVNGFLSLPFAEKAELTHPLPCLWSPPVEVGDSLRGKLGPELLGDEPEWRALRELGKEQREAPGTLADVLVEGMAAAFRRFGFMSTAWLGAKFLEHCGSAHAEQRLAALELLGISAHNVQFLRGDNERLASFLEDLYQRVLEEEQRPLHRLVVYYRLAVTLGRRQHRFDDAFVWADRILTEASSLELSGFNRAYQRAWGLNFRAYLWNWRRRIEECRNDCARGYEELTRVTEVPPGREVDHRFLQTVLVQNTAGMCFRLKEYREWEQWLHLSGELEQHEPWASRYRSRAWIRYYSGQHRFDTALSYAWDGLANATRALDWGAMFRFLIESGALCYRLGQLNQALQAFEEARALRGRLLKPEQLPPVELPLALALLRAGHLESAEQLLEECLGAPEGSSPAAQAEILSLLAVVAAHARNEERARARIQQALELSARLKERDLLIRTAAWVGHACRVLEFDREAIQAFSSVLRASEEHREAEVAPPAGPWFVALVNLAHLELAEVDAERARRIVELLPDAYLEGDTWWETPRVLEVLGHCLQRGLLDLKSPRVARSLAILVTLASQRRGMGSRLREFTRLLPEELARLATPPVWGEGQHLERSSVEFSEI